MDSPLHHQTVHILETHIKKQSTIHDRLSPFALDDCLIHQASLHPKESFLHFWEMEDTVILGMTDTKTPHLYSGIHHLKESGFTPVVRQSGGLAVVSDTGVLNISLVLYQEHATIHQAYEWMQQLIEQAFPEAIVDLAIHAHEVPDSYCPGDFDLSIKGKKFAGIAQRRLKNAICVSIYLSVNGPQHPRGELIRDFYSASLQGERTRWHFPTVNPDSMETLEQLLSMPLTTDAVKTRLLTALHQQHCTLQDNPTDYPGTQTYQTALTRFLQRTELLEYKGE